jgi:hypothetical protein
VPTPKERRFGDLLIRFHYIQYDSSEIGGEHEPTMVLTRAEGEGRRSGWFIRESVIHEYVESGKSGGPSELALQRSAMIADFIGLTPDARTCFRILEAILDSIEDLFAMPPWSPEQQVVCEFDAHFGSQRISGELKS